MLLSPECDCGCLHAAGFHNVHFRNITQHVVPSSRRIYLASLRFCPLGLLLCRLGLRTEIQTRGIASGYYQYLAQLHESHRNLPLSYSAVGCSRGTPPAGYAADNDRMRLGSGATVFERARQLTLRVPVSVVF